MKRVETALMTLIMVLIFAAQTGRGATLFEEDFSRYDAASVPSPTWQVQTGDWQVADGALEGRNCPGGYIARGAATGGSWEDYVLRLRLKVLSRGSDWRDGPWIGFRQGDGDSAYTGGFYTRMTALHKVSKGRVTTDNLELASAPATIRDNDWHTVEIHAVGNTLAVSLDGRVILAAEDKGHNQSPPVGSGGIVLSAREHQNPGGSTRVLFDDVRVETARQVPTAVNEQLDQQRKYREFLKERQKRGWPDVPHKVLAFYYPWYGTPDHHGRWRGWGGVDRDIKNIRNTAHYPASGPYDSHDPNAIDRHIREARSHGIDAFIASWWGREDYTDRALRTILDRAARQDFEVSIYWETVPGSGEAKINRAVRDLEYVVNNYGDHPAFLKVDGKPVIFVYGRVMGQIRQDEWFPIISKARERCDSDFLLIADGHTDAYARLFDGLHTYNPVPWVARTPADELASEAAGRYRRAVETAEKHSKISGVTVIPGYDDTQVREPGLVAKRRDGRTYRTLWEQALEAGPDWVLITSWNEWYEGSEIEPSMECGDLYLDLTGKYTERFKEE